MNSMLSQSSRPAKLVGQGSFRAIDPQTGALAADPASPEAPKKRKLADDETRCSRKARRRQAEPKRAYCPVCHSSFTEVASRNTHIGRGICIKFATERNLSIPESVKGLKSSNRLEQYKASSEHFEAEEMRAGCHRRRTYGSSVAGPSNHNDLLVPPPALLDQSAGSPAPQAPFATWSPAVPPSPLAQKDYVGGTASRLHTPLQLQLSRHTPQVQMQVGLQRSASYPLLQQQHRPPPDHSLRDATRLSRATSWIQPQPAYRGPAQLQASASFGGYDTYDTSRAPTPTFSTHQPRRAPAQLQASASFGGYDAYNTSMAPTPTFSAHQPRRAPPQLRAAASFGGYDARLSAPPPFYISQSSQPSQPPTGYAMGESSAEVYHQSPVVPQQTFSGAPYPSDVYAGGSRNSDAPSNTLVEPQHFAAGSAQNHYAPDPYTPEEVYPEVHMRPAQVKYRWTVYGPGEDGISRVVSPLPDSRSTGPSSPQTTGFASPSLVESSSREYTPELPASPSPTFYPQQSMTVYATDGTVDAPQVSDAKLLQAEPESSQVGEESSTSPAEQDEYEATILEEETLDEYTEALADDKAASDAEEGDAAEEEFEEQVSIDEALAIILAMEAGTYDSSRRCISESATSISSANTPSDSSANSPSSNPSDTSSDTFEQLVPWYLPPVIQWAGY
ncbi:hypothetical protein FB451DRAFT_485602 [Mycena latifolia]|nr:hypothetical protein FB451DRAFT_485602 [Mycena latifolia]